MRLLFVSHSFPPPHAPLSNVGGMQRVATELHGAFETRDDVAMRTVAPRSSWKWVHIKAVPFLARHGALTELTSLSPNLPGIAHIAGHKRVSTTTQYVHSNRAQTRAVLNARPRIPVTIPVTDVKSADLKDIATDHGKTPTPVPTVV